MENFAVTTVAAANATIPTPIATPFKIIYQLKELDDIIPAKALGMKTVWVKNGLAQYQDVVLGEGVADFVIYTLSDLLYVV